MVKLKVYEYKTPRKMSDYCLVIPEEEISGGIREMGYITVKPRAIYPSYYKLQDGSGAIVEAYVHINYLLADPRAPNGISINSTNIITAFVPKEKRRPEAFVQFTQDELQSNIIDDDVEFEVLRENFSVYDLSNGMVMSLKTVMGQIRKTKFFAITGEPLYMININPIIKIKKAE